MKDIQNIILYIENNMKMIFLKLLKFYLDHKRKDWN